MEFDKELLAKAVPIPELEHFGVKGMKWGVRRKSTSDGSSKSSKSDKPKSKIGKEIDSVKREIKSRKNLKNIEKLSDSELRTRTNRLRNENDLKRLTTKKTRNEYLDRGKLTDTQLKTRVERLRLEDALKQQVKATNKDNVDVANKIIRESAKIAISAYTGTTGVMVADTIIKESLKYAKSNDVIKQSAIPDKYKQMTF